jgi:hypothetical protein
MGEVGISFLAQLRVVFVGGVSGEFRDGSFGNYPREFRDREFRGVSREFRDKEFRDKGGDKGGDRTYPSCPINPSINWRLSINWSCR